MLYKLSENPTADGIHAEVGEIPYMAVNSPYFSFPFSRITVIGGNFAIFLL